MTKPTTSDTCPKQRDRADAVNSQMWRSLARITRDFRLALLPGVGIGTVVLLGLAVFAYGRTGSAALVLPYLQGQRLLIATSATAKTVEPKQGLRMQVTAINLTRSTVTVFGAERSCTCLVLDLLPRSVAPGESIELGVSVIAPEKTGAFEEHVKLFTDCPEKPVFAVTLSAMVAKS